MKKVIKEMESVDADDFEKEVEKEAVALEAAFLRKYSNNPIEEERVAVFDFEIN